ncbi:MAG TPA: carbon dioxide concentrating mechanism/carboxysome shell protein, partial [Leptolyngbya sp.]|nr:carbon dioxide concentrating mechanism/carboxysome shell protein [Leptolyngbya sp.]
DLDQTLPIASCWVEELKPLQIPITVKEVEKPLVALPELVELQPLELPAQTEKALPEAQAIEFEPEVEKKEAIELEPPATEEKEAIRVDVEIAPEDNPEEV